MTADVCLFLEGTYPFVAGGVSSWVHQIVRGLPDFTFHLVHLAPQPGHYEQPLFDLPDNVVGLEEGYLMRPQPPKVATAPRQLIEAFCTFTEDVRKGSIASVQTLADALDGLHRDPSILHSVLHSKAAWETLRHAYEDEAPGESFVDYFWNWVSINHPLLQVLATPIPDARCYHTISTGYAGLLAAVASQRTGAPLLLTEHGIYTKERRIEIHAADWISQSIDDDVLPAEEAPVFRRQWNQQFDVFSRACYAQAQRIVTLYEGNRREQIRGGAQAERTAVVPNGIDIARYQEAAAKHHRRDPNAPFTVAFVGRVAPIKDLRTFLSAMRLVHQKVPDLVVRVLGPMEEDTAYADECVEYAQQVGMADTVRFEGKVEVRHELPDVDVVVLSSISEAQPLVVLEAGAVGIPVVCTDVGCCNDLVHGGPAADRRLGSGGIITPIASPGATARAVLELHRDPARRKAMGQVLSARVCQFYNEHTMLLTYRRLYESVIHGAPSHESPAQSEHAEGVKV